MRGPKRDEGRYQRVSRMYLDGATYAAIAQSEGISRQRIQEILRPPVGVRMAISGRYDGRCADCGIAVTGRQAHIHHRTLTESAEAWNDIDNLMLLCQSCHRRRHGADEGVARREQAEQHAIDGTYASVTEQTQNMVTDAITDLGWGGSPTLARHVLTRLAFQAFQHGQHVALLGLMDSRQAAAELGISVRRVQALAKARNLGWRTTNGRDVIFRPEDVENMRTRVAGRPPRGHNDG